VTKLLELAEAALDEVALGVEVFVDWMLECARRIVGDHGERAHFRDSLAEVVGVTGGVGRAARRVDNRHSHANISMRL
jgi:hypothetical protein